MAKMNELDARFADGPYRGRRGTLIRLPDGSWPTEIVVPDPTSEATSTLVYRVDTGPYPALLRWQSYGPPMALLERRGSVMFTSEGDEVGLDEDISGGWTMIRGVVQDASAERDRGHEQGCRPPLA